MAFRLAPPCGGLLVLSRLRFGSAGRNTLQWLPAIPTYLVSGPQYDLELATPSDLCTASWR